MSTLQRAVRWDRVFSPWPVVLIVMFGLWWGLGVCSELLISKLWWTKFQHTAMEIWKPSSAHCDLIWIISRWILVEDQVSHCKTLESTCVLAVLWKGMGVHSHCRSLRTSHLVPDTLAANPRPTTGSCVEWVLNKVLNHSENLHLYTEGKIIFPL